MNVKEKKSPGAKCCTHSDAIDINKIKKIIHLTTNAAIDDQ